MGGITFLILGGTLTLLRRLVEALMSVFHAFCSFAETRRNIVTLLITKQSEEKASRQSAVLESSTHEPERHTLLDNYVDIRTAEYGQLKRARRKHAPSDGNAGVTGIDGFAATERTPTKPEPLLRPRQATAASFQALNLSCCS